MSSSESWSYPSFDLEEWVPDLRNMDLPEWGNVDDVVEEYFSEENTVVDVRCSNRYTSTEIANISGADVVGVDVPEVYSGGVSENKYGGGPKPSYVSGVAPSLPFKENSVDGIAALNSVTYLARSLGSVAADSEEVETKSQKERLEKFYTQGVVRDLLEDFDRITDEGSYLLLGEQSDSSYLLLEREENGWIAEDYGSFPEYDGENIHRRFRPWIEDENVEL